MSETKKTNDTKATTKKEDFTVSGEELMAKGKQKIEAFTVSGEELIGKVKEIVKKGHAKKITVKDKDGKDIISFPATVGVAGVILAPVFSALGTITALATKCTIVVER